MIGLFVIDSGREYQLSIAQHVENQQLHLHAHVGRPYFHLYLYLISVKLGIHFFLTIFIPAHCSVYGKVSFNCARIHIAFSFLSLFFDLPSKFRKDIMIAIAVFPLSVQNQVPCMLRNIRTTSAQWSWS